MKDKSQQIAFGFLLSLIIIFIIIFKLTGPISWFWVWVLVPIWISSVINLIAFVMLMVLGKDILK